MCGEGVGGRGVGLGEGWFCAVDIEKNLSFCSHSIQVVSVLLVEICFLEEKLKFIKYFTTSNKV